MLYTNKVFQLPGLEVRDPGSTGGEGLLAAGDSAETGGDTGHPMTALSNGRAVSASLSPPLSPLLLLQTHQDYIREVPP